MHNVLRFLVFFCLIENVQDVGDGSLDIVASSTLVYFCDIEVIQVIGELCRLFMHLTEHFQTFGKMVMDGGHFGKVDDALVGGVGFLDDFDFHSDSS